MEKAGLSLGACRYLREPFDYSASRAYPSRVGCRPRCCPCRARIRCLRRIPEGGPRTADCHTDHLGCARPRLEQRQYWPERLSGRRARLQHGLRSRDERGCNLGVEDGAELIHRPGGRRDGERRDDGGGLLPPRVLRGDAQPVGELAQKGQGLPDHGYGGRRPQHGGAAADALHPAARVAGPEQHEEARRARRLQPRLHGV